MPGNIVDLSPADIAKWPPPNYDHPQTRDWMPIYISILYGVTTFMAGTRLWLRAYKKQAGGLGLDDALLFAAWVGSSWFSIIGFLSTEVYMINRHMWDVPPRMYEPIALMVWIAELSFLLTSCCVKVSVLLFYRRLVMGLYSRYWVWAIIACILFTVAYTISFILTLVFNCTPTDAYWRSFNPTYTQPYHCVDTVVNNILSGVLAAVSDLYSVAIPLIMTRNFTMPRGQKIALNVIFSLGFLVVAASIIRTISLYEVGHESDVSTYIFNSFIWSALELNLGIICASAPALRSLFRDHLNGSWTRFWTRLSLRSSTRRGSADGTETLVGGRVTHPLRKQYPTQLDYREKRTPSNDLDSDLEAYSRSQTWSDHLHLIRTQTDPEEFHMQAIVRNGPLRQDSRSS